MSLKTDAKNTHFQAVPAPYSGLTVNIAEADRAEELREQEAALHNNMLRAMFQSLLQQQLAQDHEPQEREYIDANDLLKVFMLNQKIR